jgi:hypothetical protein
MSSPVVRRIPRGKRLRCFRKATDIQREIEVQRYRLERAQKQNATQAKHQSSIYRYR